MRKGNRQQAASEDVLQLLRKYDQEKELLVQENKQLEQRIFKQIDEGHQNRLHFERKQTQYRNQIMQLQKQLERLKGQLTTMSQSNKEFEELQQQHHKILTQYKQSLKAIHQHQLHQAELQKTVEQLQENVGALQDNVKDLESAIREKDDEHDRIKREVRQLHTAQEELRNQREKLADELLQVIEQRKIYEDSLEELNQKYTNSKKKRKELEHQLHEQTKTQHQLLEDREVDTEKLHRQIASITAEKDKHHQTNMTLQTKIEFLTLELKQKNNLLESAEAEAEKNAKGLQQREAELLLRVSNLQTENEAYEAKLNEMQDDMIRCQDQFRQAMMAYEMTFKGMKDKLLMEVMHSRDDVQTETLIKKLDKHTETLKQASQKDSQINKLKEKLKTAEDELKSFKEGKNTSKSQKVINRVEVVNVDKIKVENQLRMYEVQLSLVKKELQEIRYENAGLEEKLTDCRQQLVEKSRHLEVAQSQSSKLEKFYVQEIKKCIGELQAYKEKDILLRQEEKEHKEQKEVQLIKQSNYEKKIKDLIDSIERKDNMVDSHKSKIRELEEALQNAQNKLNKLTEESESVRKAKADLARKDQLMQQYKSRYELKKSEYEQLQTEKEKLKKENDKLEKSLDRKSQYLNTVKAHHDKELSEIQRKLKNSNTQTKSLSSVMENKLVQLKRECEEYQEVLSAVAGLLWEHIEQFKSGKSTEKKRKKSKRKINLSDPQEPPTNPKNWEAAKVLGLKDHQIQQFLNPSMSKVVAQDEELKNLWDRGRMLQFYQKALQYLVALVSA